MKAALILAAVLGIVALTVFETHKDDPPSPESIAQEAKQKQIDELAAQRVKHDVDLMLKKGGVTKIDLNVRKAWIDSYFWFESDAQLKERTARELAIYCGGSVKLLDAQSARELASYDAWNGFKVH